MYIAFISYLFADGPFLAGICDRRGPLIDHNMVNGAYFKDGSLTGQCLRFRKFHFISVFPIEFLLEAFTAKPDPQCNKLSRVPPTGVVFLSS